MSLFSSVLRAASRPAPRARRTAPVFTRPLGRVYTRSFTAPGRRAAQIKYSSPGYRRSPLTPVLRHRKAVETHRIQVAAHKRRVAAHRRQLVSHRKRVARHRRLKREHQVRVARHRKINAQRAARAAAKRNFGAPKSLVKPFTDQSKALARKQDRIIEARPAYPRPPIIPRLANPTPAQRHAARSELARVKSAQRTFKRQAKAPYKDTRKMTAEAGQSVNVAGFGGGPVEQIIKRGGVVAAGMGKAVVEHPGETIENTAKSTRDTIAGFPAGVAKAVTDPIGTAKGLAKDFERRYPDDPSKVADIVRKEGVTSYALDAATILPTAGAIGGKAARAGMLGAKARRTFTKPRPKLRTSGGTVKEQKLGKNLASVPVQRAIDKQRYARLKREAKKTARDPHEVKRALQPEAADEVTPYFKRTEKRSQARGAARERGRTYQRKHPHQAREIKASRKELRKLSKSERKAFKYVSQLGITSKSTHIAHRHLVRGLAERDVRAAEKALKTLVPRDKVEATITRLRMLRRAEPDKPLIEHLQEVVPEASHKRLQQFAEAIDKHRRPDRHNDDAETLAEALRNNAFTDRLANVAAGERRRTKRAAMIDPSLNTQEQAALRRYSQQAEILDVARKPNEPAAQFIQRVRKAARKEGLQDPGYFESKAARSRQSSKPFATGPSLKADAPDKHYEGELFRTLREDPRISVHEEGIAKNIRRAYNWNHVAEIVQKHAFGWSKAKGRHPRSAKALREAIDSRQLNPDDIVIFDPQKYFAAKAKDESPHVDMELGHDAVHDAVKQSVMSVDDMLKRLETEPEAFQSHKLFALPREVFEELDRGAKPSGAPGRVVDIAKQKSSRILLSTRPDWLGYQALGNATLTGLSGTGPIALIRSQPWWRKLPPHMTDALEPLIGVGHFRADVTVTKMGSTMNGKLANAYRALKAHPWAQAAGKFNPLDVLPRLDNAQNNAFRRALFMDSLKRQAFERLGQTAPTYMRLAGKVMPRVHGKPEKIVNDLLNSKHGAKAAEEAADFVNKWLGDYMTFTRRERQYLQRWVMFYPFLRFSLRFTFYTLPATHPTVTAILGQLGQLNAREVHELLGGEELPLGKFYFKDSDNKLSEINVGRFNPSMNALTSARHLPQIATVLPPYQIGALMSMFGVDAFSGKYLRFEGNPTPPKSFADLNTWTRVRTFLRSQLELAQPYKVVESVGIPGITDPEYGPQGADSLLGDRPIKYKRKDIVASIARDEARQKAKPYGERLVEAGVGFYPKRSQDIEVAKRLREKKQQQKKKKTKESAGWGDAAKW